MELVWQLASNCRNVDIIWKLLTSMPLRLSRATCSTHYIRHEEIMDALRNALDAQVRTAIDFEAFVKEVQAMPKVVCYESSVRNQLSSIQSKRRICSTYFLIRCSHGREVSIFTWSKLRSFVRSMVLISIFAGIIFNFPPFLQ